MNLFKKFYTLLIISSIFNALTSAKTFYVSPSGADGNVGSITQPWLTWSKAFDTALAGDTVYFRGGTYPMEITTGAGIKFNTTLHDGTAENPICFFNYPGEVPILDCSAVVPTTGYNFGIIIESGSYLYFKGLQIRNVKQHPVEGGICQAIYTEYNDHVKFENMTVYNVDGVAFMTAYSVYTDIINCDAYNCCDYIADRPGDWGTGFGGLNTEFETGYTYYYGCRAWNCSDNGYTSGGQISTVIYDNCWAYDNRPPTGVEYGDGNGFKLGYFPVSNNHDPHVVVKNCIGANNHYSITTNDGGFPAGHVYCYNNFLYGNTKYVNIYGNLVGGYGVFILGPSENRLWRVFRNNLSYNNEGGDYDAYEYTHSNNSWDTEVTVTDADFLSVDYSQLKAARKADGSLPDITFGKLVEGSDLIDAGMDVGIVYNGTAPDIGYSEFLSGSGPVSPVYSSSVIENTTPARLEMTYSLTLANIVPATSAFTVMVNSNTRSVSSVAISGTKVLLTLSSPVVYGDIVTVAYTKPSTNQIQTIAGGEAASLPSQLVTNRVSPPNPVFIGAVVENATPSVIEMTYNLSLANIVPSTTAFTVKINSTTISVSSVSISGTKVQLALSSPVTYGTVVTVSYTKPSTNPLQTSSGGQASSLSEQPVTNNVNVPIPVYQSSAIENATPAILEMTYNLTLANILPSPSAFNVMINSVLRPVNSVSVSGTKVLLTLSSPAANGDIITVAYIKPSINPIQTTLGGQAASLTTKMVTNKIGTVSPVYVTSSVEDTTPYQLEMTYSLTLANIIPATSAFTVNVNSVVRTINRVAISGNKVLLTLSSPIVYGNVVTVAYNVPSVNPLQTPAGGQAATLIAQAVINNTNPLPPVYVTSSIENATPAILEMTYDQTLANIIPATSAFSILVNSAPRSVTSLVISGTKVLLTLSTPVEYGDIISITYIKPSINPLQSTTGGQAVSITAQSVTNRVVLEIPIFISASIENTTPSRLEMTYDLNLANIVPPVTSFIVLVNSVNRAVNSVVVSGNRVLLMMTAPVYIGDIITVSYTKPASNPLQTVAGAQASSLSLQPVENKVTSANTPPVIVVNYQSHSYSGFVNDIDAGGSYDVDNDNLTYTWIPPNNIPVSSTTGSSIKYLGPVVDSNQVYEFTLRISDGRTTEAKVIPIEILTYKPELEIAELSNIEASSFQSPNYPSNINDGNIGTMWAADGDNQWLIIELAQSFYMQHVRLAFQPGQRRESYFDILGSTDKVTWEPILTKSASCSFSGDKQVFEFPPSKTVEKFDYLKLIGLGNSEDKWNYISELEIFGSINTQDYEKLLVKIYPNPAKDHISIRIDEPTLVPDFIQILNISGAKLFQGELEPDLKEFTIPLNLKNGIYIVLLGSDNKTLFAQKLIICN